MKTIVSLLLMLLLLLVIGQFTNLVKANPVPGGSFPENPDMNEPTIDIKAPGDGNISKVNYIILSFSVQKPSSWINIYPIHGDLKLVSYILDGKKVDIASDLDPEHTNSKPLTFTKVITGLLEGNHSLQVYLHSVSYYLDPNRPDNSTYGWWKYPPANYYMDTYSPIVNFTVDTVPPSISNLSIENNTYKMTEVPLIFNVNEASEISYSLDNQANVTMIGNTTLTGLANGSHNMIVYATDTAGHTGKSQNISFIINLESKTSTNSSLNIINITFVAVIITAILVFAPIVILFYERKYNKTN
jgi:hypothetical protein